MPLLAAAVGVFGGVGGAYIGGVVANAGQEQRSQSERAAAIQDLRIQLYGDYLGSAADLVGQFSITASDADQKKAFVRLLSTKARVVLIAQNPAALEKGTDEILEAVDAGDEDAYKQAAENFRAVARDDTSATE